MYMYIIYIYICPNGEQHSGKENTTSGGTSNSLTPMTQASRQIRYILVRNLETIQTFSLAGKGKPTNKLSIIMIVVQAE